MVRGRYEAGRRSVEVDDGVPGADEHLRKTR